jgi:hypothetical protein
VQTTGKIMALFFFMFTLLGNLPIPCRRPSRKHTKVLLNLSDPLANMYGLLQQHAGVAADFLDALEILNTNSLLFCF